MRVVGSATTGHQGIEEFLSVRPDVTLMDLGFRDMSGIDVIAAIRRESPDARIVVLTIPRPRIEHNPVFLPIATAERQRKWNVSSKPAAAAPLPPHGAGVRGGGPGVVAATNSRSTACCDCYSSI